MTIKLIVKGRADAPTTPPLAERVYAEPIITIGSDPAATLCLAPEAGVSPEHAILINEDGQMLLINRADGTSLNGESLMREARRPLAHGDCLEAGDYAIYLLFDAADPRQATAAQQLQPPVARDGSRNGQESAPQPQQDEAGQSLSQPPMRPPTQSPTQTQSLSLPVSSPQQQSPSSSPVVNPSSPAPSSWQDDAAPPVVPAQTRAPEIASRNFAAILDSLRTEEDRFYLLFEGGSQTGNRVTIETAEMSIGWDATGQNISVEAAEIVAARAVLRKDWSGVVIEARSAGMVSVNGEPLEAARRLRNGDRLMLVPTSATTAQNQSFLIFHEPASLVVLDTMLPQKLPPPVMPQAATAAGTESAALAVVNTTPDSAVAQATKRASLFNSDRKIFGYFTPLEVSLMIAGTLITAVIVFLLLEHL